ncbi:MAG TPA: TIGR04282 family arsenosugar biosynthesis glycosyltransferase [Candidatus Limnocylindrales bacterium]|nr:TIGR04282 family arsenosugar biosynthesis glycosyltransferase [Candidatus Limnocylindrales bacterium]
MRGDDALILLAKAPAPGTVKTRMCPPLSHRGAAEFYACLLADAAGEAAILRGVRRYLFFAPPEGRTHFLASSFSRFLLREQAAGDLGERMARAAEEAFAGGARRVVLIGADCPALSAARIRTAFGELADAADAVFGPAGDGGFYLAGLNGPAPSLFRGIEWSTPTVLASVLSRCRRSGMTYALLPVESDVDTGDDLAGLRRWARTHRRPPCLRTRRWLRANPRQGHR